MKNYFMRVLLLLSVIVGFSCTKSKNINSKIQDTCLPMNLQNGVVAFYTFGNGSLSDFSGNGYDLLNPTTATPGADRAGNPNCAFSFNRASSDFLEFQNPTFLDNLVSSNMTISFWYKSNDSQFGNFITRDTVRTNSHFCNLSKGVWSISFVNGVLLFGTNYGYSINHGIARSNWQHVVVTSNSSNLQLYIDGTLKPSGSDSSCPVLNQGNLYIGKFYNGLIDDIIIYNRILTATEINQLLNLPACCQ